MRMTASEILWTLGWPLGAWVMTTELLMRMPEKYVVASIRRLRSRARPVQRCQTRLALTQYVSNSNQLTHCVAIQLVTQNSLREMPYPEIIN